MKRILLFLAVAVLAAAIAGVSLAVIHAGMPGWYARWWYPLEHAPLIRQGSEANRLDAALVAAIIYHESSFDNGTISPAGAMGLMQLMPATATWIGEKRGTAATGLDLRDPDVNIAYGCWYLRYLVDRYGDMRLALAAYNGGTENVDRWLREAGDLGRDFDYILDIPYPETRDYITDVEATAEIYRRAYPEELGINQGEQLEGTIRGTPY